MPAGSNPTTFYGGWIATATVSGPAATASAAPASAAPADFWGEAVVEPPVEGAVSVEATEGVVTPPDAFERPAVDGPGGGPLTFAADIGVHTAYAARGLNTFAARGQQDVAGLFAPALEVGFGDTGLAVGWIGALQLNGENAAELVATGVGAENDVFVSWSRALGDTVELGAATTVILYPMADAGVVGTETPALIEPAVNVTWSGPVELGAEVVYSAAVQPELGVAPYAYLHLVGGKTVDVAGLVDFTAEAGVGYKAYPRPGAPADNQWDVSVDLTVARALGEHLYVAPGVHGVWTNLSGKSFGESAFVWGGINLGGSWG
jgi:hypothetical protein